LFGLLIDAGARHANEEVILVLDEEDEHVLTESVFHGCHIVLRVGDQPRLEYCCQVGGSHAVEIRLGCEDCQ
jgi:hypothetical protein